MAIEFSRNITFGQYLDLRSPIHQLDPRTKMVAVGLLMIASMALNHWLALLPLVLAVIAIQTLSRIPLSYTLRGLVVLVTTISIFLVFQVLFYPAPADPLWSWGILSISWPGLAAAGMNFIRVLLLYYLVSTLMLATPLVDIADGSEVMLAPLKRIGVPVNELVMIMVIALKFVPLLVAELERLIKAQAARGVSLSHGKLSERATALGSILVPLFVGALARAEVLTTAMEARGYRGGQGRTKRRVLTLNRSDLIALLLVLLLAATSIAIGRVI